MLWKGNEILSGMLSKRISWIQFPVKRFVTAILVTIAYTLSAMYVIMKVFESLLNFNFAGGFTTSIYGSIVVTILISLFLHGRQFLIYWRQATIEKEKFQKESITARYEALKNQVNPHFLFNSLNALTNLVYEDQDKAVKFIKQLADVYRYVLDSRDKEVVSIDEELQFLNSYLFLQQIRFGDKLKIDLSISTHDVFVAPLALQMLVENAIKHNVISEDDPLTVKIFEEHNFICVENNLQKKKMIVEPSAGVGLDNIRQRYVLLTTTPVAIIENIGSFKVMLPFLTKSVL